MDLLITSIQSGLVDHHGALHLVPNIRLKQNHKKKNSKSESSYKKKYLRVLAEISVQIIIKTT